MEETTLIPVMANRKFGYIDASARMVIPPTWEFAGPFREGLARVGKGRGPAGYGGFWGFIDREGREVIAMEYQSATDFRDGFAVVNKGGKEQYVPYDDSYCFTGGNYGYIDKKGKTLGDIRFEYADPFKDGFASVRCGNAGHYIDTRGEIMKWGKYTGTCGFSEGLGIAVVDGVYGWIDTKGRIAIKPKYALAYAFSEGLAPALDRSTYTYVFVDKSGTEVFRGPDGCNFAMPFSEGRSSAQTGGSRRMNDGQLYPLGVRRPHGFLDKSGRWAIPPSFDYAFDFHGGRAMVQIEGKFGFIDRSGKIIIPVDLTWARDFDGGFTTGIRDGRCMVFRDDGSVLWQE